MTEQEPELFLEYCKNLRYIDYARAGSIINETITIPIGPLMVNDEPLSHTLESQLRSAGMPILLKKGVLILDSQYELCREGDILTADQAKLLKIFFYQLSEFKISPLVSLHKGIITEYSLPCSAQMDA